VGHETGERHSLTGTTLTPRLVIAVATGSPDEVEAISEALRDLAE
jgi:hypothetical protein